MATTYDSGLMTPEKVERIMREEKAKAKKKQADNMASMAMRQLGAGMYRKGKERQEEEKVGGKALEAGGRLLNRFGTNDEELQDAKSYISKRGLTSLSDKKKQAIANVMAPAKMGTNRALCWAWGTLIPSWGISLLYINLHVFLRFVIGETFFCKLGDEWIPPQAKAISGDATKTVGKMAGIVECMVLLFLDLLIFSFVLGILGVIVMMVDFQQASVADKIKTFIGGLSNLRWSEIKALYNLFH